MSKIIQNGKSHMVVIPKQIIDKLKWDQNTQLFINLDSMSGKIIIEKIN